jgi:hypothetical protein
MIYLVIKRKAERPSANSIRGVSVAVKLASPGASGCAPGKIHPLPLRKPVPPAPTVALEFHHAPAALRADQIDNRGNDA